MQYGCSPAFLIGCLSSRNNAWDSLSSYCTKHSRPNSALWTSGQNVILLAQPRPSPLCCPTHNMRSHVMGSVLASIFGWKWTRGHSPLSSWQPHLALNQTKSFTVSSRTEFVLWAHALSLTTEAFLMVHQVQSTHCYCHRSVLLSLTGAFLLGSLFKTVYAAELDAAAVRHDEKRSQSPQQSWRLKELYGR